MRRTEFEELFGQFLPKKSKQSEAALVSSYMRTAREVANVPYIIALISKFNPSIWGRFSTIDIE